MLQKMHTNVQIGTDTLSFSRLFSRFEPLTAHLSKKAGLSYIFRFRDRQQDQETGDKEKDQR